MPRFKNQMLKDYYSAGTMARAKAMHNDQMNYSQHNIEEKIKPIRNDQYNKPIEKEIPLKNGIEAYANRKGFERVEKKPFIYDGDTYYTKGEKKGRRVSKVHAPEVANRYKGTPDKPGSLESKARFKNIDNNYDLYQKDTGTKTPDGRSVYELMYANEDNFMRLDSMMAHDGFSIPATKYTTPELEKLKQTPQAIAARKKMKIKTDINKLLNK